MMFRFDHDASRQRAGSSCALGGQHANHDYVRNPIERVAAPTICWTRKGGICPTAMRPSRPSRRNDENQMAD